MEQPWRCPTPDPYEDFEGQSELILISQCILGEAEGEDYEGKLAVAWVIKNRVNGDFWPSTTHKVILQPKQFSCFNNSERIDTMQEPLKYSDEDTWFDCFKASVASFCSYEEDPTFGSNHYHTENASPSWSKGKKPTVKIGNHLFFKL